MSVLQPLVSALAAGSVEVLDLTTPLSNETPILNLPQPFANTVGLSLAEVSNFNDDGPAWAWNDITIGEHAGTHLDAPTHWISGRDGKSVDRIEPRRLVGPAVVIDKTAEVKKTRTSSWSRGISRNGRPSTATSRRTCWVLFRTGWSSRGSDAAAFINADDDGPHTPGVSPAAAQWLAANASVSGFGVER